MSDWNECLIGDYIDIQNGFAFKSEDFKEKEGLPVIKIKNVASGKLDISDVQYYEGSLEGKENYIVKRDDILIAMTGSHVHQPSSMVGKVVRYDQDTIALLNQRVGKIYSIDKNKVDENFLFHFYKQEEITFELALNASGSANQANISPSLIKSLIISLPSVEEQKAIASVLSSLDDKIDLLHRQNKTLEAMAEVLFRCWFGEKENNGTLQQLIKIQNGYAFKSKDFYENGTHRVIKIKNISDGIIDINKTDFVKENVAGNVLSIFRLKSGDILIAMTGAEIGKLGIIPKTNKAILLNQRVGLLKEKFEGAKYLAYLQLKSDYGQDYIENTATGSAQPNISGTGIESCGFPKLKNSEIIEFSYQMKEIYEKIIFNLGQINTIESVRQLLLPKLMTGEIRIKQE